MLRISADWHLYDSEFQIEGALTINAFADNAIVSSSVQIVTIYQNSDIVIEFSNPDFVLERDISAIGDHLPRFGPFFRARALKRQHFYSVRRRK